MLYKKVVPRPCPSSELLENFDSIDIIVSGHQHRSFITKIKGVICSQPMHNGQSFTKIVIDTDREGKNREEEIEKILKKVQLIYIQVSTIQSLQSLILKEM